MRSTGRAARLVACVCGAAAYGAAWWALLTAFGAGQGFGLLVVALFVGLATGIGVAVARFPAPARREPLRWGALIAVAGLFAGGVSVLVMNNHWPPALTVSVLAVAVAIVAIVAGAWTGVGAPLRASLAGPLFGMVGGVAFGLGFALTFAATYTNPCFPGHRYCLDPARWYFLPMGLEAGLVAGLWLGLAVCAALMAASLPLWMALAPETGAAG